MKRSLRGRGLFGRLLLCALLAGATSAPVSADQYGYDELGNVETLSNPRGVRSYSYDEIQRLDTETGYSGNRDHAYDLNGNRTTDGASAPGTPTTATYTSNTNRIATLNGAAVTLDAAGQITNDGLNSYTWDDAGRLKTMSRGGQLRATYYYDHKHRRTRKVTTAAAPQGAKTLVYHYDDQDRLIAETTETGAPVRSYLWADTTLLAQVEYTLNATTGLYTVSRELLFELDHLGTPRQARLTGGSAVWRWESDGYGNTLPDEDPDGNGQKTYVYLRFPGQYYDEESGLHYNWHRYYVPRLGRYLSSDPIGIEGGENTYTYVGGNPLIYTDPTGEVRLPNDPSGLPGDWQRDPRHRDPNGERWRHPSGDVLDWHRGRPGMPGWRGKDHWHHNGGNDHLPPGTEVPDPPGDGNACGDDCKQKVATVVTTAAGGYIVYRCIRMIPSLAPPLWWTIPGNLAAP